MQYPDDVAAVKSRAVSGTHSGVPHGLHQLTVFQETVNAARILEMQVAEKSALCQSGPRRHGSHGQQIPEGPTFRSVFASNKKFSLASRPLGTMADSA